MERGGGGALARRILENQRDATIGLDEALTPYFATVTSVTGNLVAVTSAIGTAGGRLLARVKGPKVDVGDRGLVIPTRGNGLFFIPSGATDTTAGTAAVWGSISGTLANQTDLQSALDGKVNNDLDYVLFKSVTEQHMAKTDNPHSVTKAQVGLGNVPNVDATLRANHTGTQPVSSISATGTPSSTTYLRGDGTWSSPAGTTYDTMSQAEAEAGTATTSRVITAARLKATIQFHGASKKYIASRGENLITNGNGYMQDNTNFSSFVFDPVQRVGGFGSFKKTSTYSTFFSDEFIPVDVNQTYQLAVYARTQASDVGSRIYIGIAAFDSDELAIQATHHMRYSDTDTTLAQPLAPGDTVVYLTSAANWRNASGTSTWQRSLAIYGYANSAGYVYPNYTYTRRVINNAWADGAVNTTNNTITLTNAFPSTWGTIPAGTAVSNGTSGGTYKYVAAAPATLSADWSFHQGLIGGVDYSGTNITTMFPPGLSAVKLLFLVNNQNTSPNTTNTQWIADLRFSNLNKKNLAIDQVDNTSDANKPISTATQTALNGKVNNDLNYQLFVSATEQHLSKTDNPHSVTKTQVGLANVPNVDATNRANHTGVQPISSLDAVGTRDATTFLRGDGSWAVPSGSGGGTTYVTMSQAEAEAGTLTDDRVITPARLRATIEFFAALKAHTHHVNDLTATGTKNGATYLRGDNTWSVPPDTQYPGMSQAEAEAGTDTNQRTITAVRLKNTILYHGAAKVHTHPVGDIATTGGTAGSTTYLRGDGTWNTPTNTTYDPMPTPELEAGTAATARTITAASLKYAVGFHPPATHTHHVNDMTATGTKSTGTYLRGDNTWSTPPNTTYAPITQAEAEDLTNTTGRLITGQRLYQGIAFHAPLKSWHVVKELAADFSTTSTTESIPTSLNLAIGANEIWQLTYIVPIGCDGAGGAALGVNAPTGSDGSLTLFGSDGAQGSTTVNAFRITPGPFGPGLGKNALGFGIPSGIAQITATIKNGTTAGNVSLTLRSLTDTQTSKITGVDTRLTAIRMQ